MSYAHATLAVEFLGQTYYIEVIGNASMSVEEDVHYSRVDVSDIEVNDIYIEDGSKVYIEPGSKISSTLDSMVEEGGDLHDAAVEGLENDDTAFDDCGDSDSDYEYDCQKCA